MASADATTGCSTKRNFIGPAGRAIISSQNRMARSTACDMDVLFVVDGHGIRAEREADAFARTLELEHHAVAVLEPELAVALVADGDACSELRVDASEFRAV